MQPEPSALNARLELALTTAREAGRITLRYFRRDDLAIDRKGDDSPVTAADRQAEEHLRKRIAGAFPDDGILGEEFPERPGSSGFRWILDPIDGTKSFIHGVPLYGTLVGIEHQGQSVVGVNLISALDECVYAASGGGAWYVRGDREPAPARVSTCPSLAESLFLTSEVINFDHSGRREVYDRLQAAARLTRTWGDCYGYLLLATGRAELMVDPVMEVWDAAALLPILEEAGGTFTDWQGRPTIHSREGIATNGQILDEVLAITRTAPAQAK
jgi:histidinol phosphatase-like enzyme (inositol monophosphatase family)